MPKLLNECPVCGCALLDTVCSVCGTIWTDDDGLVLGGDDDD